MMNIAQFIAACDVCVCAVRAISYKIIATITLATECIIVDNLLALLTTALTFSIKRLFIFLTSVLLQFQDTSARRVCLLPPTTTRMRQHKYWLSFCFSFFYYLWSGQGKRPARRRRLESVAKNSSMFMNTNTIIINMSSSTSTRRA